VTVIASIGIAVALLGVIVTVIGVALSYREIYDDGERLTDPIRAIRAMAL
jgi:hypothetical protein